MAHFVSSVAILTVLAGMALLHWLSGLRRSRPQGSPEPEGRARALLLPGLLLPAVMVAAWEVYQATAVFGSLARLTEATWQGFVEGEVLTRYAYYRVGSYVERSVLWSLALRYIWLIVGMGLGGLVGLVYLARVRRLAPNQTMAVGGLTGVGLLGLATALGSSGEDLFRVLFYVPVFTALLLLLGISALGRRIGRYAFAALALLLFVLSFPSLLNNNYTVGFSVYYPTELASGEYLRSSFGQGKTVEVFGGAFPVIYYTPGGDFRFPDPVVVGGARFWVEVQNDVERSVLWSLALRYIWLIVSMGLGGLVGLVYLARVRRLAPNQTMAVGGLTGVGLLGLAIALGSSGEDLFRVLFYVPALTTLLLLLGISALGRRIGRYAFAALALLLFVLSFPSLLNNNYTVGFSVY